MNSPGPEELTEVEQSSPEYQKARQLQTELANFKQMGKSVLRQIGSMEQYLQSARFKARLLVESSQEAIEDLEEDLEEALDTPDALREQLENLVLRLIGDTSEKDKDGYITSPLGAFEIECVIREARVAIHLLEVQAPAAIKRIGEVVCNKPA